ncbi:MAG: AraC family transcriptional regulator [Chloroflexi bacterium]|nr:MAG: AraC family transcriptional regulator [Chloroflexota bacterium]MBL1194133.1 AraC family transcriptional regulator [Chloroflexota bacterium]NOH11426.1 AraC family transcriptional regulator [Chloroflexota bacterium]
MQNKETQEWSRLWHHRQLKLNLFQAYHSTHTYPRHSHDYYVIAVVERGVQSFIMGKQKHVTPVGGLILLNPGDVHTGEPISEEGYGFIAFYPTAEHMRRVISEITGRHSSTPNFSKPRSDDPQLVRLVRSFHQASTQTSGSLEHETLFVSTLAQLTKRLIKASYKSTKFAQERAAVRKARQYIEENYAESISLSKLADHVNLSRYYFLRVFRDEVGMPPHTYLDTLRIQKAQAFIAQGRPLAQVAQDVGFSSQSHFTQRFKQTLGVTPGKYARQL